MFHRHARRPAPGTDISGATHRQRVSGTTYPPAWRDNHSCGEPARQAGAPTSSEVLHVEQQSARHRERGWLAEPRILFLEGRFPIREAGQLVGRGPAVCDSASSRLGRVGDDAVTAVAHTTVHVTAWTLAICVGGRRSFELK